MKFNWFWQLSLERNNSKLYHCLSGQHRYVRQKLKRNPYHESAGVTFIWLSFLNENIQLHSWFLIHDFSANLSLTPHMKAQQQVWQRVTVPTVWGCCVTNKSGCAASCLPSMNYWYIYSGRGGSRPESHRGGYSNTGSMGYGKSIANTGWIPPVKCPVLVKPCMYTIVTLQCGDCQTVSMVIISYNLYLLPSIINIHRCSDWDRLLV